MGRPAGPSERKTFSTMNASARIETRAEVDSEVHFSHDVSERLVTDTNAASDAEVTWITAPEDLQVDEPQLAAAARARTTSPSWWQRAIGGTGGTPTGVTVRPPREVERTTGCVRDTSSCPTPSLSPRSLQEQLATLTLQAGIAEATARIVAAEQDAALGRRKTAEHLLATADMTDALARRSRPPSPAGSGRHPSPPPTETRVTSSRSKKFPGPRG